MNSWNNTLNELFNKYYNMSRKNGTEITFQEKFKDRMENMGKDGVIGIMKNTENPINTVEIDKMKNWNNLYNECMQYLNS